MSNDLLQINCLNKNFIKFFKPYDPYMLQNKIELSDLTNLKDGTIIDVTHVTHIQDASYKLVCDEINDFIEKPKTENLHKNSSFFQNVPVTALKESIDSVLKKRNVQEERLKKHMQFEFDRKMQHINKIKSKTYRKMRRRDKLRKEQALKVDSDDTESGNDDSEMSEEEELNVNPIMTFNRDDNNSEESVIEDNKNGDQHNMIKNAFVNDDVVGNEVEFMKEKLEVLEKDAPSIKETVMPGWDEWAGEGIETKKTKYNTMIEKKDGIRISDRKDFKHHNIIINETIEIPDKYKANLPYGYSVNDYKRRLDTPISAETNSLRIFKRFMKIGNKEDDILGKVIKPTEFEPEY